MKFLNFKIMLIFIFSLSDNINKYVNNITNSLYYEIIY